MNAFTKGDIEDIVSLADPNSLVRSAFKGTLVLADYSLPEFSPNKSYKSLILQIMKGQDVLDHLDQITDICKQGRHTGKREVFHSGVVEAVRNAYQHGNKKDPHKKIDISYRSAEESFEIVVSDEGGNINADFIPFILLHRYRQLSKPLSFYEFSNTRQPYENAGIGTFVIHMVSDEVNYFRNKANGLSVQMIVRKR